MRLIVFFLATLMTAAVSQAQTEEARVDINWVEPEKFTDVRPSNESRQRFRERTFEDLHQYLEKLMQALPKDQRLVMTVTDLDLAGQVWPGSFVGLNSASDVRLIKRVDIPRMHFDYKLLDADGEVIKEGSEELKDMAFQDKHNPLFDSESLRYEKNMLREWFQDTFVKN